MPARVKGFVKEDADGNYNVYIREQDPREVQAETYLHELEHIRRRHLQREEWSPDLETEAEHGKQSEKDARRKLAGTSL